MGKTLFINLTYLKVQFFDFGLYLFASDCFEDKLIFLYNSDIIIIQINNPLSKFNNRSSIGSNKVFTFSHSNNQRASLLGCKQSVELICADYNQSICTFNPVKSQSNCLFSSEITLKVHVLNEIGKYLCISLAGEFYTPALKMFFNLCIVFNYSVMNNYEIAFKGGLGMCVQFIGFAMSGPPCVAHACCTVKTGFINEILKILYPAGTFEYSGFSVNQSHSGRIISAIFQPF